MNRAIPWLNIFVILGCLSACIPYSLVPPSASAFAGWRVADLRYLQAPDADPQHSLIAVYQRQTDLDLEIRMDLLDLAQDIDFDLYLVFDTRPGGSTVLPMLGIQSGLAFDLLIKVPANGPPMALDENLIPIPNLTPRTANHPRLGMVTVALNRAALPGSLSSWGMQVFLTTAGKNTILSETPPILPGQAHPKPAPLLLVFWDTLPAASPSETLRRWEGAHTGPLGGRHGLSILLQAAHKWKIPLVLADLSQPASLAGLSAVGGLARLRTAAWGGEVLLPDLAFGDPLAWQESQKLSHLSIQEAGFPLGKVAFGALTPPLPSLDAFFFADLADNQHVLTWQGQRLVPLPAPVYRVEETLSDPQLTPAGLSLAIRQALLDTALADDPARLVVAGGSLPGSEWGDLSSAPAAFEYIAAHPWIMPLRIAQLETFPARAAVDPVFPANCHDLLCSPVVPEIVPVTGSGQPVPSGITLPELRLALRRELQTLPAGNFSQAAWQSYLALTIPTPDLKLAALQANALGQVGYLVEAARWNLHPTVRADCTTDLDFDGMPECMLASETWLAVIEPDGGRLMFAAQRSPQGAAQWIGAASQFAVGLGDDSEWRPQLGPAGDPADIPGAFGPPPESVSYEQFNAQALPLGQIVLRSPDGSTTKTFTINGAQLQVEIQSSQVQTQRIPITLPANASPPAPQWVGDDWLWQPSSGPGLRVTVQGAATLASSSCLDTAADLLFQENPNRAYPPGHYLPYPLAVIEVQGSQLNFIFSAP